MSHPSLAELLAYLQSDHLQERQQAAIELARREDPALVEPLRAALDDPDATVRANAATGLGNNAATEAVPALIDALRDPADIVRERAATALAQIGDPQAIPALIDALDDSQTWARNRIIYVLGASGDARAVEPLIVLLDHDDPSTQGVAAWALGALGDGRALAPLRELVASTDDASVRGNAAWALGEFAEPSVIDDLLSLLDDPSPEVRGKTAWALGNIGEDTDATRMVAPLLALLDDYADIANASAHVYVCQYAAEALSQIGTAEAQAAVERWKPQARERLQPRRIQDLIRALQHPDSDTRTRAIAGLQEIGTPAIAPLTEALQSHENARVRQGAAQALGELHAVNAVHALTVALTDPDVGVWSQATAALGKLGAEVATHLRPLLTSDNLRVKYGAAIALWRSQRHDDAFRLVLQAVQDDDVVVRGSAITSFWQQPDERAVATLQIQLQDEEGMMARYILQALQTIGGATATQTVANWLAEQRG